MFSSLLLSVMIFGRQQPKVSLELRGVRLENAAPILAKALGFDSLAIGPTLTNEVLLIRCKDVEPTELRDKIAKALNATWESRAEGWRLTQSDEQKAAERKIFETERYKYFSQMMAKAKKKLGEMPVFDEAACKKIQKELEAISKMDMNAPNGGFYRRIAKIDSQSPLNRLAARMAMRVTPDMFMKLSDESPRIVYCSQPTAMQSAFPFQVNDLLGLAMQEQNTWSNAGGPTPIQIGNIGRRTADSDEEVDIDEGMNSAFGMMNSKRDPYKTTDFATVTMTIDINSPGVEIAAYDKKGKQTLTTTFFAGEDYAEMAEAEGTASSNSEAEYEKEIEKARAKIEKLDGDAREYVDLTYPLPPKKGQKREKKAMSPTLRAKILQPETIDPLSIAAPEILFDIIKSPNIVMNMGEELRFALFMDWADPRLERYSNFKASTDGNWFLYSSKNPIASRKTLVDRKVLGPILRFMDKNQRDLTLEEQASIALLTPTTSMDSYYLESYFRMIRKDFLNNYNDKAALRLYGTLSESERKRAVQTGIPIGNLSETAKRELFRSIFASDRGRGLSIDFPEDVEMSDEQVKKFDEIQELVYGGIYGDPTFAMPNGLLANFILKFSEEKTASLYCNVVMPQNSEQDWALEYYGSSLGHAMDAEGIGRTLYMQTKPELYGSEGGLYKLDENNIRLVDQRNIEIKLMIAPNMSYTWTLRHTAFSDPKIYTLKTLPQKYQEQIQKGYKDAETEMKDMKDMGTSFPTRPRTDTKVPPPAPLR